MKTYIMDTGSYVNMIIDRLGVRLSEWESFNILPAGNQHDHLISLVAKAGWNQTEQDLVSLTERSNQGNYMACINIEHKNLPIASSLLLPVTEQLAWIGMVLVLPEARKQGIARVIMEKVLLDARKDKEVPVIGLDATPDGKVLYEKIGFKTAFDIHRCVLRSNIHENMKSNVNTRVIKSVDSLKPFLNILNYQEMIKHLEFLHKLSGGTAWLAVDKEKVCGFLMSRPGRLKPFLGPLMADRSRIAETLIKKALGHWNKRGAEEVFADIPGYHLYTESSVSGNSDLKHSDKLTFLKGIRPVRNFSRMYHLVNNEEKDRIIEYMTNKRSSVSNRRNDISSMMEKSVENYEKTLNYMKYEKDVLVPHMFSTGGPEFS